MPDDFRVSPTPGQLTINTNSARVVHKKKLGCFAWGVILSTMFISLFIGLIVIVSLQVPPTGGGTVWRIEEKPEFVMKYGETLEFDVETSAIPDALKPIRFRAMVELDGLNVGRNTGHVRFEPTRSGRFALTIEALTNQDDFTMRAFFVRVE